MSRMEPENDLSELLEKWAPVLDAPEYSKIRNQHVRDTMAVLLENQLISNEREVRRDPTQSLTYLMEAAPVNSMGASSSTASDGSVDIYDPVLISLVRRSMPNLIAYDVCGVQPMAGPTGLIFALRSRYGVQTGIEALFNEANSAWSATSSGNTFSQTSTGKDPSLLISSGNTAYVRAKGMTTAQAEALGDAAANEIQQMAFSIEKVPVTARSRALKAEYTNELAQDLRAIHGLDAEAELANILSAEILAEINREVIGSIYTTATIGAQENVAAAGTFDCDVDSNGRWSVEKWKGLMYQIEREANQVAKATRRGKGNWIITSSDVASALKMAGQLDYSSALIENDDLQVDDTGNTFAGVLFGRYRVYIDPYFISNAGAQFVTVGYKGASPFDSGLFYCPYVPLQMYRAVGQDTFQPKIAFKTRYGLVAHPFGTTAADGDVRADKKNLYFRIFRVLNIQ